MADVRAQLIALMERGVDGESDDERCGALADAILERWELTPKPVVSAEELGSMARYACHQGSLTDKESRKAVIGTAFRDQLEVMGLVIARKEDAK